MRYGIVENNIVVNVIVGEESSVINLFHNAIKETETTGPAWIGARYNGNKFEPQKVYNSWNWSEELFDYEPPIPYPTDGKEYRWDKETTSWISVE